MRRVVLEDSLDEDVAVAVAIRDGHEVWMVNPRCSLEQLVEAANECLKEQEARHLSLPWRVLGRVMRPLCQRVHTSFDA